MGARLAKAALNPHWATVLSPGERVVLLTMSLTALDPGGEKAREYWGGWEYLYLTLKGDVPEDGTPAYESARAVIRKMVRHLRDAGAIQTIEQGSGRRRSRYRITPDHLGQVIPLRPVDNTPTPIAVGEPPGSGRGSPPAPLSPE